MSQSPSDFNPERSQDCSGWQEFAPYRGFPSDASSDECLQLANRWLRDCRANHSGCARDIGERFQFPIRLIDTSNDILRLSVLDADHMQSVSYMALSHCWGGSRPLTTKESNLAHHMTPGIDKKDLPKTFRDAVDISRGLGFQYLWIDSLCIVQDNEQDWEEQSSQMASVYGEADLVLGAAVSASADEGFLGTRSPFRESSVLVPAKHGKGPSLPLGYRVVSGNNPGKDPLDTRGWALQERSMARRYLAYGASEMHWVCVCSAQCECGCYMFTTGRSWMHVHSIKKTLPPNNSLAWEYPRWRSEVLTPYSSRRLTKPTDKLVALSAFASLFQASFKGNYLAGLWKEYLLQELLWETSRSVEGRSESSGAPSWSWASVSMEGQWVPFLDYDYMEGPGKPLVQVLEASTCPSTINPFGPVSCGVIKLSAIALPTTVGFRDSVDSIDKPGIDLSIDVLNDLVESIGWLDTPLAPSNVTLEDGTRERVPRRLKAGEMIGDARGADELPITAVPLLYAKRIGRRSVYVIMEGLLLGKSVTDARCFERLGTFRVNGTTNSKYVNFVNSLKRQEVVMI